MILYNARCVEPGVTLQFHSSYYSDTMAPAPRGNAMMIQHLRQWPQLLAHLFDIGAFSRLELTTLYSWDLQALGVPVCGSW